VMDVERALLAAYADPATVTPPPELGQRGGSYYSEAAVDLLASLLTGDGATHVVNVRNGSTLSCLGPDDVIETACRVDADGAVPLPQPPVPDEMAGRIAAVSAYERLIARAAVTGERRLVRQALLAHPLVGEWGTADELTSRLLSADAEHLTRFR
jgi:6-phospho-beta-glucosidase